MQHQLEKKELEDKLNSEMQRKMEEHRESASKRENLLQEEVKTWQVTLNEFILCAFNKAVTPKNYLRKKSYVKIF